MAVISLHGDAMRRCGMARLVNTTYRVDMTQARGAPTCLRSENRLAGVLPEPAAGQATHQEKKI